jgi:hypothetical protein
MENALISKSIPTLPPKKELELKIHSLLLEAKERQDKRRLTATAAAQDAFLG